MEKTYNPKPLEQHWYQTWEQNQYFLASGHGVPYCIMLPPPNVTGTLHMGHGFQVSLMDTLIRYHRMCGDNTLWQVGTDHAGIATQMVVERQLLQQGIKRYDLGRESFVDKVWEWKAKSDGTIKGQLRRMGASGDWTRERFSMDEDISQAVLEVFTRLYDEGLIYRGKYLVNWDPVLKTAISDLEVISQEEDGWLWHIRYPVVDSDDVIIVATTRPETMLGDVAVTVHPDDERYHHLHGKKVKLPLTDRTLPIITDEFVEKEFGTGCVKITPAHDFNDYSVGQRHQLPVINIFTPDARLNELTPTAYQGLDRFEARKKIVADLESLNLLEKTQAHKLQVPRGDRSGAIIEPYLTDQWYMKMQSLAEGAMTAVKQGDIEFVPESWTKIYFQWLENIEDWCISRQLWWGHRVPAWYDDAGNVYVGCDEHQVREKYKLDNNIKLTQDTDVLDTWFSAALWPFATLGWPQSTEELTKFYPTNVLVTGFDIIFFWVARMVMLGLKFTGKVPFKQVYITGLIRDSEGQKMSKSKGNILDPIDLIDGIGVDELVAKRTFGLMQPEMAKKIEKNTRKEFPQGIPAFGTDALRFTFCALATTGRDIRFDLNRIDGYRNFCNKIWNAARYVIMNTEDKDNGAPAQVKATELNLADRWIRGRLQQTIQRVHECYQHYRFDLLAHTLYEFTWNEYCDWYLELAKPLLNSTESTTQQQIGTRQTLLYVLETLLRLIHPLMPFITEEIWQRIAPLSGIQGATIMLQPYPTYDADIYDQTAVEEIEWLKQVIIGIRNIRGEMNISPGKLLPLLLNKGSALDHQRIETNRDFLQTLAKLESIIWIKPEDKLPLAATALVGDMELLIPMAQLIDKNAEIARLNKEKIKMESDLEKVNVRLNNPDYLQKAPAEVVAKEKIRADEIRSIISKLVAQLERIETI